MNLIFVNKHIVYTSFICSFYIDLYVGTHTLIKYSTIQPIQFLLVVTYTGFIQVSIIV